MPLQVTGKPFIWESNVTLSNGRALNHVHALKVHSLSQDDCYHVQPKPSPLPSFYPARPIYFYTLAIMRNQMAVQGYKFQKKIFLWLRKRGETDGTHFVIPDHRRNQWSKLNGLENRVARAGIAIPELLLLDILGDRMLLKIL